MTCVFTFQNGDVVSGQIALKAYLTKNLTDLVPKRAIAAGIQQAIDPQFSRTEQTDGATFVKSADQSPANALNAAMVKYGLGQQWSNAYESVELPNALSGIGQEIQAVFGRDVRPVAPTATKFDIFNGVNLPGRPNDIFVNVGGNVGFIQVAGHELWHTIARERPDLIKWYRSVAQPYYKDLPLYQANLNSLLQPGEQAYSDDKALEELEADVLGDSLADAAFLQKLADASPSKFKAFMNIVQRWLASVAAKMRGLKSEAFVTDIEALRDHLAKVVAAYADGKDISEVGAFTPSNPTFSRAMPAPAQTRPLSPTMRAEEKATAPKGLTPPEQGVLRRMQAALQDNMNRVRQVQDRIEKISGSKLPDHINYYGADANRPGRIAARLEDAQNKLFKPLMQKLAKSGFKQDQLEELLHAMHAQERNEAIARVNDEMPDGGSGMLTADAQVILNKYKGKTALLKLADEARQIASATLDLKLSYGLITQESYDALAKVYDYYVPLKGDGEYGPKVKRALGHDEREEHILQNITRDYDQAVVVGEKNLARQALLGMVLTNPNPDLWTVGMPPKGRTVTGAFYEVSVGGDNIVKFTNLAEATLFAEQIGSTASIEYVAEGVRSFVKPLQDNEVMVYVEGRAVRIQIKGDEQLARQLRPLNQAQMNPILEGMRTITRYLSKIYTGYNPAFILKNAARDASTGTINIMGNEGTLMAAKAWANYPAALKTMGQWASTKKIPAGETGAYLAEYRAQGGKVGASYMGDLEQQGATLERLFDDAYGASGYLKDGKPTKAAMIAGRKIVGGMAHVVEIANQATENGLRLALFMALRKSGKSAAEAARSAKNVTVDFDRKGSMTGALGAIYLFFNPAVQGTANALKTLVRGDHKGQAMTALGALGLLGLYAASQGMDDDKDRWLGEKWDTRTKNLILNVGGHRISVPMSQEFAPFYAMGVAIGEAMRGESPVKSSARMVSSFIDAYFPLRGVYDYDSNNKGADAIGAFVPTVIKPGFEVATNRNSFGSQVVPENEFTKSRPDNLKMFRATKNTPFDKAAQYIAEVGEAMGAGKYENDISKVSPETLKYAWRTYTGGLGSFITDTIGVGSIMSSDPSQVVSSDVPFVKDFYKSNDVKPIRSRFYQLADEVNAAAAEFKEAKKAGDGEAIDKIFARPGMADLIGLEKLVKHTAKVAAQIRDQEVDINADPKMTPAEKKTALKELEKQEEEIYRSAIDAFK